MYALSRGPSKIVASTRRGPATQLHNLEIKGTEREPGNGEIMSSPKPYFSHHMNMKRGGGMQRNNSNGSQESTSPSPQHDELVKFVMYSWSRVETSLRNSSQREGGPVVYKEKNHNPDLQGFEPFDLENYWRKRTMQKLTGSSCSS